MTTNKPNQIPNEAIKGSPVKFKMSILIIICILMSACSAITYQAKEYVIAEGRIPQYPLAGKVKVINIQNDETERSLCESSFTFVGNYKDSSLLLSRQLEQEISKNAHSIINGKEKTISVKVTEHSAISHSFHITSTLTVEVSLGNGKVLSKSISHAGPYDVRKQLNGSVAISIIEILKDRVVLAYLSS